MWFLRPPTALLTNRFDSEFDAKGVVDQAVENAVGDGRIVDLLVPASDRHLGSENDGSPLIAVVAGQISRKSRRIMKGHEADDGRA